MTKGKCYTLFIGNKWGITNMKIVEKCLRCGTTKKVNFDGMCKECYDKSVSESMNKSRKNEEISSINENSKNRIFTMFKEKFNKETFKTILIIILVFLLFCFLSSDVNKINSELYSQVDNLTNQISQLQVELEDNESKLKENEKEITKLKNEKTILEKQKSTLEDENGSLEKEKGELTTKVEELEKSSAKKKETSTSTTVATSNSKVQKDSTSPTSTNTKSSGVTSMSSKSSSVQNYNSDMVWIGKTGSKYHKQSCPTLKGNGSQVTMQQALADGRTACKVCY